MQNKHRSLSDGDTRHIAHLYEDDSCLTKAVAEFIASGLHAGEPAIVLATQAHTEAITAELKSLRFNVKSAVSDGYLTLVDAMDALAIIMVGTKPDHDLFLETMTGFIRQSRTIAERPVRIYGELVDLLWHQGNPEAAVRLEVLWNELGSTSPFSLLCGYNLGNVYNQAYWQHFQNVCREHREVLAIERTGGLHRPRKVSMRRAAAAKPARPL